ncbi:hypothetical protein [Okeania sp.]|uniref:hypothetical protein n=1 Tax=Okeania sp. TaxID=3100323 RepID=UPI002B4AF491|nr:hypothetical protein [Okeania sp.]MEB3343795.1 hypothetical protein [Okeania sp.]
MLRKQSKPLARLRRDLTRQYLPIVAMIGSVIFFGGAIATLNMFNFKLDIFFGEVLEWVTEKDLLKNESN